MDRRTLLTGIAGTAAVGSIPMQARASEGLKQKFLPRQFIIAGEDLICFWRYPEDKPFWSIFSKDGTRLKTDESPPKEDRWALARTLTKDALRANKIILSAFAPEPEAMRWFLQWTLQDPIDPTPSPYDFSDFSPAMIMAKRREFEREEGFPYLTLSCDFCGNNILAEHAT